MGYYPIGCGMISIFDLFKIGIGPSSSHTVGPMKAALLFVEMLDATLLEQTARVQCELFGSLGATGKGHGSDTAVMLGLMGEQPETVAVNNIADYLANITQHKRLVIAGQKSIAFNPEKDILLLDETLPYHPNAMRLTAFDTTHTPLLTQTYYSVGGGFVLTDSEAKANQPVIQQPEVTAPYAFTTAAELLQLCQHNQLSISQIVFANEQVLHHKVDIEAKLAAIWQTMQQCVENGRHNDGVMLPGGLHVKRRAKQLYTSLLAEQAEQINNCRLDPLQQMDWVNLYALAVNEENAGGGRVVTAPTNGAAGVIPAVLHFYKNFCPQYSPQGIYDFLLTASAIGMLIKTNASISGAEVGCQGEVGSACAMAAAGLTQVLGGTPAQCANAAEIGLEHNLGLTCDPIAGLVQVPCIERNAMAAVKAINAARLALRGNGEHCVSLDSVIQTMKDTGADMMDKYKETAKGGLAIHVVNVDVPVSYSQC